MTQAEINELDALTDEQVDEEDADDEDLEDLVTDVEKKADEVYRRTLAVAQVAGIGVDALALAPADDAADDEDRTED